ncbi:MAG: FtsW/RodA/SpoVE family cell cycle protein, partial [Acidimicrobiia bacterium]|nr:FtsW/RodA/SpoVE family cell cycle protein [Acidimicrobiia bacterium]
RQPDLGTILVYVAVTAGIVLLSGVRPRHLAAVLLGALLLIGAGLASNQLETYQLARFSAFLDETPEDEAGQNARFNVEQAQIAIGNGGLTGTGLFEGSQTRSELVSEQQTDFIFTVVAEELGFAGSATLLALFALLLMRIWRIAQVAQDMFGALICMGVFSMLLFHVFQSVGMTLGMMPVTGIPLPFVSYGGSSLIAMFVAVGLVLNVNMHRYS